MAKEKEVEPYPFVPAFARAIVYYASSMSRFWGRIGKELDADAFSVPAHRWAITACKDIARETGNGPMNCLAVLQRLRRYMHEGKVANDVIEALSSEFDAFEDQRSAIDDEAVINEAAPVLRRRLQKQVVEKAMSDYSAKGDLAQVIDLATRARSIGGAAMNVGTRIGGTASWQMVTSLKGLKRMSTGVLELDARLGGGMPVGQAGAFMSHAGGGKSMGLSHVSSHGWMAGMFVCYATLELPVPYVIARIKANATGVPIDAILEGSEEAERRLKAMEHQLGALYVNDFAPQVTTVDDLFAWVALCEEQEGRKCEAVVADYLDKVGAPGVPFTNEHATALAVWEPYRLFAYNRTHKGIPTWAWTASQSRGREERKKGKAGKGKIDLEDTAGSVHKPRVLDLLITMNERDGNEIELFVAKNRTGANRFGVTTMTDFACGAIGPVDRNGRMGERGVAAEIVDLALTREPGEDG